MSRFERCPHRTSTRRPADVCAAAADWAVLPGSRHQTFAWNGPTTPSMTVRHISFEIGQQEIGLVARHRTRSNATLATVTTVTIWRRSEANA